VISSTATISNCESGTSGCTNPTITGITCASGYGYNNRISSSGCDVGGASVLTGCGTICTLPTTGFVGYTIAADATLSACSSSGCASPTFTGVACSSDYYGPLSTSGCSWGSSSVTLSGCYASCATNYAHIGGSGGSSYYSSVSTSSCATTCSASSTCVNYAFNTNANSNACSYDSVGTDSATIAAGTVICSRDRAVKYDGSIPTRMCSASSYSNGYSCRNALDGVSGEWATNDEQNGAWIEITFAGSFDIGAMLFANRADDTLAIRRVELAFYDAANTLVGSMQTVNLRTDSTTYLLDHVSNARKVRITIRDSRSGNVGASRIVFYDWATSLIQCASEGGNCHCTGRVKYGVNHDWTDWMYVDNNVVECSVATFGVDPAIGSNKVCMCQLTFDRSGASAFSSASDSSDVSSGWRVTGILFIIFFILACCCLLLTMMGSGGSSGKAENVIENEGGGETELHKRNSGTTITKKGDDGFE